MSSFLDIPLVIRLPTDQVNKLQSNTQTTIPERNQHLEIDTFDSQSFRYEKFSLITSRHTRFE